jgi:alpha-methylacyl-CoA racemase
MERTFAARFAERTLQEWREAFAGSDACVTPVATLRSAPADPHVAARGSVVEVDGVVQAAPAPRFGRTPTRLGAQPPMPGADTDDVLADWAITVPDAARASGALSVSTTTPVPEGTRR